jgi:hypothetical protein
MSYRHRVIPAPATAPSPERPKQRVHMGRTQSGIPGLFTGGYMACHLTEEEFADPRRAQARAERMGFEWEGA